MELAGFHLQHWVLRINLHSWRLFDFETPLSVNGKTDATNKKENRKIEWRKKISNTERENIPPKKRKEKSEMRKEKKNRPRSEN
jgi:hypothetical protein